MVYRAIYGKRIKKATMKKLHRLSIIVDEGPDEE
jgi:hypothetical protein